MNLQNQTDDVLQFFSRSADKPAGKGVGDLVSNPSLYVKLNSIPHWRRTFSSLWVGAPFKVRGKTYRTHEHALQALKFESAGKHETAEMFSLESETKLAKGGGHDARKARKIVMLSLKELSQWEKARPAAKDEIYLQKYTQIELARRALLGTRNAQLYHCGPRMKRIRCIRLETIREKLQAQF